MSRTWKKASTSPDPCIKLLYSPGDPPHKKIKSTPLIIFVMEKRKWNSSGIDYRTRRIYHQRDFLRQKEKSCGNGWKEDTRTIYYFGDILMSLISYQHLKNTARDRNIWLKNDNGLRNLMMITRYASSCMREQKK